MRNLRITQRSLTDGSIVYGVKFVAVHGDQTDVVVTMECNSGVAAERVLFALHDNVSYAETDAS